MNADAPKNAFKSVPTVAPTGPTMFPEGNHSPALAPMIDAGTRDNRRNSARARSPTAKISCCCSRVSISALSSS